MNLRRIFERKIRSRSSKNTPYLYVPRTFETENKGWSKWFGFPIPCFLHFCLFTCTTWAFPAINKSHCLAACQYRILRWITVSMPEKTAVFTRSPGQSSLRKPVGFVIFAGLYGMASFVSMILLLGKSLAPFYHNAMILARKRTGKQTATQGFFLYCCLSVCCYWPFVFALSRGIMK